MLYASGEPHLFYTATPVRICSLQAIMRPVVPSTAALSPTSWAVSTFSTNKRGEASLALQAVEGGRGIFLSVGTDEQKTPY